MICLSLYQSPIKIINTYASSQEIEQLWVHPVIIKPQYVKMCIQRYLLQYYLRGKVQNECPINGESLNKWQNIHNIDYAANKIH